MRKFKFVEGLKRKLFVIAYKQFDIDQIIEENISVKKSEISYFPFSHNTIKIINRGNDVFFYRECLLHGDFESRIDLCCKEFLDMIREELRIINFNQEIPLRTCYSEEEILDFEAFLELWKKNKTFYKELKNLNYYKKMSGFGIWKGRKSLSSDAKQKLAIPTCIMPQEDLLAYFLIFISGYIESWLFHEFLNKDDYETFFASRSLATYKLASFLGLNSLVPRCKFVKLEVEGEKPSYGVLCEKSAGIRGLDCEMSATPELQRDLSRLSILDALTYETDHFANNYNVLMNDKGACGVCAFDNDSKWTFFPNPYTSRNTARKGAGLINGKRKISLYYVDKDISATIKTIDKKQLRDLLSPYLNKLQITALMNRLKIVRKALLSSDVILLEPEKFNASTLERELSSGVCSYLYQYVHRKDLNNGYNG